MPTVWLGGKNTAVLGNEHAQPASGHCQSPSALSESEYSVLGCGIAGNCSTYPPSPLYKNPYFDFV